MLDAETTIDNAIAAMQTRLPGRLSDIDAEKGDFELDVPADESYSLGSKEVLRYPWVEVAVTNSDITDLDVAQQAGTQTTQVIVAVRYQCADADTLDRALRRYARAVVEVLMEEDSFGAGETVRDMRIVYGTNPEYDEKLMLSGVAVVGFSVEGIATLP